MTRYDIWLRHCTRVQPLLDAMGRAGLRIDVQAQREFAGKLQRELDAENKALQAEAVGKTWRSSKVYKRVPKKIGEFDEFVPGALGGGVLWRAFNPNSWQQVGRLARSLGAKLPLKNPDEDAVNTERKYLLRLSKRFPVFKRILFCRERRTYLSRYVWEVDNDQRVHTTLGFHPSTWRLSSRNINLFNVPKRSDLAGDFRRLIVASPGTLLVEGDSNSIEAVLVGYFAKNPEFIRLAQAGLHDWVTAAYHNLVIPLDLSNKEMRAACVAARQQWPRDHDLFKRINYLSLYLGTPHRIWEEYPEEFEREADAKRLQAFLFAQEPWKPIAKWQQETCERANRETWLENPWGYRHAFYAIFQWDRKYQKWRLGDDAKRAVAFLPQSTAAAIQREIMLDLVAKEPRALGWLRPNSAYDALTLEVPKKIVTEASDLLRSVMTQVWPQLEGLSIGADIKVGERLSEMEEM